MSQDKQKLLTNLGYRFSDADLLDLALTHRSKGTRNNERLEFLGDSLLNFIIAEELFRMFPNAKEGQLSRQRAFMVKGETLAALAQELNIGSCLALGSGELKSGGWRRSSILANTVEALIGAIYLDSDFATCSKCVLNLFNSRLTSLSADDSPKDAKTQLQEYLQSRQAPLPLYKTAKVSGEAHNQLFVVQCRVKLLEDPVTGTGLSRRAAEQDAAAQALTLLQVT